MVLPGVSCTQLPQTTVANEHIHAQAMWLVTLAACIVVAGVFGILAVGTTLAKHRSQSSGCEQPRVDQKTPSSRRRNDGHADADHVLVTGGGGYLGTHVVAALLQRGARVTVVDNFCTSNEDNLARVSALYDPQGSLLDVIQLDVTDTVRLGVVLRSISHIDACIHLAALKSVSESCASPLAYYDNNVGGTVCLLRALEATDCRTFVFSSSATVYGDAPAPVHESSKVGHNVASPYGWTKCMAEQVLRDFSNSKAADHEWSICIFRYFNPAGAHPSGEFGEQSSGPPNNLLPRVLEAASGTRSHVDIYGDDYPTADGTAVRDYVHVVELASAHTSCLHFLKSNKGVHIFNLGSGSGYSVKEVVAQMQLVSGRRVPTKVCERRPGDVAVMYADVSKAAEQLNWEATLGIDKMCEDAWKWAQR